MCELEYIIFQGTSATSKYCLLQIMNQLSSLSDTPCFIWSWTVLKITCCGDREQWSSGHQYNCSHKHCGRLLPKVTSAFMSILWTPFMLHCSYTISNHSFEKVTQIRWNWPLLYLKGRNTWNACHKNCPVTNLLFLFHGRVLHFLRSHTYTLLHPTLLFSSLVYWFISHYKRQLLLSVCN